MPSEADVDVGPQGPGYRGRAAAGEEHGVPECCPLYHRAVELIGRRWTGAILEVLVQGGSLRFSQIAVAVTDLSDRMLSDRLKELEAYGVVRRTVFPGPPVRVEYSLTRKGEDLAPALAELKRWARAWLATGVFENGNVSHFSVATVSTRIADRAQPTAP
jgi:DNA-binding HxlR family transcriptional regulator